LEKGDIAENLFTVRIISDADYNDCRLTINLFRGEDQLAFIETGRFDLPMGSHEINNVNLADESFTFEGSTEPVRIEDSGISEGDIDDLTRQMYSSGQLPVGTYRIETKLHYPNPSSPADADHIFFISNPTMINLVSPGSAVGLGAVQEVFTEYPVFQWNGSSGKYQILVFEKKNDYQSVDDVLNSFPNWQSDIIDVLSVQYPSVGSSNNPVIPLEFGKTYYWLIKMFVQTSSGENELLSEVWQFTLVDPSKLLQTADSHAKEDIQRLLSQLIGNEQAEEIARGVSDFRLKSIRINGRPITVQELYQIIDQYQGRDLQILDLIMHQSN
jgi:hypothetical protein